MSVHIITCEKFFIRTCEKIFKRYNYPIELLTLFLCRPQVQAINESNRFESEIREEQEAKKKQAEDQKQRRAAFKNLQSAFK